MKRMFDVFLSVILIVILLFIYALQISAAEITFSRANYHAPVMNTDVALYYSQLINYFGHNRHGSCAHNAMAMLLSYYDTFVNDNFVPTSMEMVGDTFEYGSPGTLYENDLYNSFVAEGRHSYREYIDTYSAYSLHLYLISMSIEKGFYGNSQSLESSNLTTPVTYGLYEDQIIDILEDYLLDCTGTICGDATVCYASSEEYTQSELVDMIADLLESDTPVMCLNYKLQSQSGNKLTFDGANGHCLIAYDCDNILNPTKQNIRVHTGWSSISGDQARNQYMLDGYNSFDYIYSTIWINDSFVIHECSDNYYNGQCGCQQNESHNQK